MGEDPDRIRREIEQTRAEMSETVDALGYKADVKERAKESLQDKRDSAKESVMGATQAVKEKLVGAKDTAGGATARVGDATPDREQVKRQARQAKGLAQENPLGLAIGSIAVGFIAGLLVPATRIEDEKLGQASDQVIAKAKETGQEALEHGKQVAQETAQSAQETLKDSAQQHGQEVGDSARERAEEVRT